MGRLGEMCNDRSRPVGLLTYSRCSQRCIDLAAQIVRRWIAEIVGVIPNHWITDTFLGESMEGCWSCYTSFFFAIQG